MDKYLILTSIASKAHGFAARSYTPPIPFKTKETLVASGTCYRRLALCFLVFVATMLADDLAQLCRTISTIQIASTAKKALSEPIFCKIVVLNPRLRNHGNDIITRTTRRALLCNFGVTLIDSQAEVLQVMICNFCNQLILIL